MPARPYCNGMRSSSAGGWLHAGHWAMGLETIFDSTLFESLANRFGLILGVDAVTTESVSPNTTGTDSATTPYATKIQQPAMRWM